MQESASERLAKTPREWHVHERPDLFLLRHVPSDQSEDDRSDFRISFVFQTGPWWEFDLTREVDNLNSLRFSGDKESSELISERGCAVDR